MKKKKYLKDEDGFVIARLVNFPCDYWKLCERVVIPDKRTNNFYRIEFDDKSKHNYPQKDVIVYLMYMRMEFINQDPEKMFGLWNFTEELTEEHDSVLDIIGAVFGISFDGEDYETRGNWETTAGCDKYLLDVYIR